MQFALRHVPGVACAHGDWQTDTATVGMRPGTDREALLTELRKRGYDGKVR